MPPTVVPASARRRSVPTSRAHGRRTPRRASLRSFATLAVLLAVAVATAGCSATTGAGRPGSGRSSKPAPEFLAKPLLTEQDHATGHFLAAILARFDNDYDRATRETAKAVAADPQQPRLRGELAELYVRQGELRKAREQGRALVTLQPGEVEPRLFVARLDLALQDFSSAIAGYQQVLQIDGDDEEALILLGALYARIGDHARAADVLRRSTALSPESFLANYGLGKALSASGQYEDALRSLRHAARLSSTNGELQLHLGYVYDRLGMRAKAIEAFQKAIDFQPDLEQARSQLGALDESDPKIDEKLRRYERLVDFSEDPLATCAKIGLVDFQRGDYMRAITDFHIVLAARPGMDEMRYWLARSYEKVGDLDSSARALEAVSPGAARYVDARLLLSALREEKGDLDGAVEAVRKVLVASPDNVDALRRLVGLHRAQKRYDEAIATARRLVELEPGNDMYLYSLAWLYDDAGDKEQSVEILRRVIEMNPQNGEALNHLGYTWAERGENLDEAESLIRRALEIHPENASIVDSLAWVYYQRGDYASAVRELEKATALGGRDPVIVEHLGDVYLKVGRDVDADRSYRDAAARTEDPEQRRNLQRKIREIRSRWVGPGNDAATEEY